MAIRIKTRTGESVQQMMRRFKNLCEKEGLTKEVKKRQYFESLLSAAAVPPERPLLGWFGRARKPAAVAADSGIFVFSLTHFVPLIRSFRINVDVVCVSMLLDARERVRKPSFLLLTPGYTSWTQ